MYNKKRIKKFLKAFDDLQDLNIFLIGETIIDRYIYVDALGRASKDAVLSTRKIFDEKFAGGVLAIANHIAHFGNKVELMSLIGEKKSYIEFIKDNLLKNVNEKFFVRKGEETIIKTRFLENTRLTKLFKYENTSGKLISESLEKKIINNLENIVEKNDIIIVADFGHGFLTEKIRRYIVNNAPYLSLNVQTNSSNFGFNPISKYDSSDFISLNQKELEIFFQNNEYRKDDLFRRLINLGKHKKILLTAGKEGVLYWDGKNIFKHKAYTTRPVDTVGAGDAVFSIGALLSYIGEDELIPEATSIAGAIVAETIGNKEPITKNKILNFVKTREKCQ
jgi:bifunctional ADP-heptose synthase (sugar kinase/adenylyltransferase)